MARNVFFWGGMLLLGVGAVAAGGAMGLVGPGAVLVLVALFHGREEVPVRRPPAKDPRG